MSQKEQIKVLKGRIASLYGLSKSEGISIKDVCEKANLKETSVYNALGLAVKGKLNAISEERLTLLEETMLAMVEEKLQPANQ
ncbi:MAG: hypothetical protein ABJG33_12555 [Balneola sp.]